MYKKNTNVFKTKTRRHLNELIGSTGLLRSSHTVASIKQQFSADPTMD